MKLACVLVLAAGCAGASKSPSTTTTTSSSSSTTTTDTADAVPAAQTTATVTPTASSYSCFNYSSGGTQRYGCSRTADCSDYLEQARAVGGLQNLSGCATVEAVFCFHHAPSAADAEGSDVCQPTMEACASERAALVRAGQSADSDCARR